MGMGGARPALVTFSGLDGAGKSTQIDKLTSALTARGLRVCRLTMYDDVSIAARLRGAPRHGRSAAQPARATPPKPRPAEDRQPLRKDKNRRDVWTVWCRQAVYPCDLLHFALLRRRADVRAADVVIMDRYFFDSLVNLLATGRRTSWYVRPFLKLTPAAALPVLLAIDPAVAAARTREYPVDYLKARRQAYLRLFKWVRNGLVVDAGRSAEHVHDQVMAGLGEALKGEGNGRAFAGSIE